MEEPGYQKFTSGDDQSLQISAAGEKQPSVEYRDSNCRGSTKMGGRTLILVGVGAAVLGISLGVLIGWFSSQAQLPNNEAYKIWQDALKGEDEAARKMIIDEMKADNIKENLR